MFNREEFDKVVAESGYKQKFIAESIGMDFQTFADKKTGRTEWKLSEIQRFCDFLKLPVKRRQKIFTLKVD